LLRRSDIQFGFDTVAVIPYDATASYYSFEDLDSISITTWGGNIGNPVNPAAHYYTYGLALKDVCGGTSIPNLFHTTINLKANTSNSGATFDLTWNAYGGLPFGIFELHKETDAFPDVIFGNVSSNVFNYTDINTAPDTVRAYWVTVPLDDICDTSRAAIGNSSSNIIRRDALTIDGVKNFSKGISKIDINPNPNNGSFTLSLMNDFKNQVEIEIISVIGNSVWSSKLPAGKDKLKVELPDLQEGVYLIQLTENNKKHYKKMVINK
jgi:hypothetical protein